MVIRTYFEANNTLIYNQNINTGKNPVMELFYGGVKSTNKKLFSRFIFKLNLNRLKEMYDSGEFPIENKLNHTLKMINTSSFDISLLSGETGDGKDRTTSFNLNLIEVNEDWDEGVGYNFNGQKYFTSIDSTVISNSPSNWFERTTYENWSGMTGSTSGLTLSTQHFSDGNENLEMNVTDVINNYLTGNTTHKGLAIVFDESFENKIEDNLKYVGFFSRHTQTFFEPYLETKYDNNINDNRGNFFLDKLNKLYLYVNVGGFPTNVDDMSSMGVTIHDNIGNPYTSFTENDITHESKGVYSIKLSIPDTGLSGYLFEDIWTGITINGVTRPDIEMEFELKSSDEYYNIGSNSSEPKNYVLNVSGVRNNENIKRGDIRKVLVTARVPYTVNQKELLDSLEYRLYVKEGRAEHTVIDYTPVNLTFNHNYFLLDTQSLLPNTYYLDIKAKSNYEVITTKNIISFAITNQVDKRDS